MNSQSLVRPTFAVCICTRNRVRYLGATIDAALKQELSVGTFDVLVVDNGSTDGTADLVAALSGTDTPVPVRYAREEVAGLSRARNRAIAETTSDFLVFLDDDAIPEPGWLAAVAAAFASAPDVDAVGGGIVPVFECGQPETLPARVVDLFTPQIRGRDRRQVSYPHYPYGANIAFRRTAFRRVGLFREDLGYCGDRLMPAEETELLLRIEKSGGKILFEPRAVVHHLIPAARTSRAYLRRRFLAMGQGQRELEKTRRHDCEPWGLRDVFRALAGGVREYRAAAAAIGSLRRATDRDSFDRELQAWAQKGHALSVLQEAGRRLGARLRLRRGGR